MDRATKTKLLTQKTSKLTKVDLLDMMRKEAAWEKLSSEARARLVALLPKPRDGDIALDAQTHPLRGPLREYVEISLLEWQRELGEGRETKTFQAHRITTTTADIPLEEDTEEEQASEGSEYEIVAGKRKKK